MEIQDLSPETFKKKLPETTSVLGIDYGIKRIGVAISDMGWMIATPLKTISGWDELDKIMKERQVGGFVIGLPRQMNGREGSQAELTRKWAQKLEKRYGLPLLFWDERLSSKAISRVFVEQMDLSRNRQKALMDKTAAAFILQGALDYLNRI